MKAIYLDNNATTRLDPMVLEAMMPFMTENYGNPSSIHGFGEPVRKGIERAREQVAGLLGAAHDSEIIFTSCATEANSTAILSAVEALPERKEIITSVVEHPAILEVCEHLERRGYTIHRLPVDTQGRLDLDHYQSLLSDNVALVSVMWANNETGTVFPVQTMATMAKEKGILFHTDGVQAVGKFPINLASSDIDMLSFSGHKIHAPKGVGALYVKRGTRFRPLLRGGHQERGRRAGTENAAGIVGLGMACELAEVHMPMMSHLAELRDELQAGLLEKVPCSIVTGDVDSRTPNTLNIAFEFIEGEAILLMLNQLGIAASSGSACTSGSLEPSHVMRAMSIPYTAAHGSVRFSLSRYTRQKEIDYVLEKLPPVIERLRSLSPYWVQNKPDLEKMGEFAPAYA
ncbi:cysteine desulfurase NifS [Tolumonas auensis DSM 9187]|uniref:Cysteine desulfurase n=1 Tax=Tolumonas auensis (strain DSM 9187 / NBRC 110442 / TA 4) TaxID=595494 RepID=C4LAT7_TOLAT|nr:cysteine desulfurase NifS [Tolumonas auensis]ACQ92291.1 cysteine desulfurase NifS [Tolumonas auensis DSM 9187]